MIDALITGRDGSEIVRDQIAAILLNESVSQQAFALAAVPPADPDDYVLRVFVERTNPWAEWMESPEEDASRKFPLINVWVDSITYDMASSNVVERQKASVVYNIDCYGYGLSEDDPIGGGHVAGDEQAAFEAQRAARLVRRILMAATYVYLDLRGTVWRRWPSTMTFFQPQFDARPVSHVQAARIALQVELNEWSPQVHGEPLEALVATVKRSPTGEILFVAEYPPSP
jgi:hypothetical protein